MTFNPRHCDLPLATHCDPPQGLVPAALEKGTTRRGFFGVGGGFNGLGGAQGTARAPLGLKLPPAIMFVVLGRWDLRRKKKQKKSKRNGNSPQMHVLSASL